MKKLLLTVALLAALPVSVHASSREWLLFGGANTDTTEQASPWIPIRGANRVVFKMWSTHSGTYTGADSTLTDSLRMFRVLLSDSLCCTMTDLQGQTIRGAADSIVIAAADSVDKVGAVVAGGSFRHTPISNQAVGDTSRVPVALWPRPTLKQLRAPASGTGVVAILYPIAQLFTQGTGSLGWQGDWVFPKNYLRVRVLPMTRLTEGGRLSTAGIRTAGLKGFKMTATVYYDDVTGNN